MDRNLIIEKSALERARALMKIFSGTKAASLFFFSVCFFVTALLPAQSPNILLIVSDDLNTRIGPYLEVDNHTPNLDRLAERGVRFSRAHSQFPLCGPSRASLMSGLYPETNGVLQNNDQPGSYKKESPALANHPSMAGFFRERGYFTGASGPLSNIGGFIRIVQ